MVGFKVNDEVILEGKEGFIGGIHNYATDKALKEYFGEDFELKLDTIMPFNKYFGKTLIGTITHKGLWNMFVIKVKDRHYLFCNDYHEMQKLEKKDNIQGKNNRPLRSLKYEI